MCIFFLTTTILTHENEHKESEYYKIINICNDLTLRKYPNSFCVVI